MNNERQAIVDYYQNEIDKVKNDSNAIMPKITISGLEHQCKLELEAYDNGKEYTRFSDNDTFECEGCGS